MLVYGYYYGDRVSRVIRGETVVKGLGFLELDEEIALLGG